MQQRDRPRLPYGDGVKFSELLLLNLMILALKYKIPKYQYSLLVYQLHIAQLCLSVSLPHHLKSTDLCNGLPIIGIVRHTFEPKENF